MPSPASLAAVSVAPRSPWSVLRWHLGWAAAAIVAQLPALWWCAGDWGFLDGLADIVLGPPLVIAGAVAVLRLERILRRRRHRDTAPSPRRPRMGRLTILTAGLAVGAIGLFLGADRDPMPWLFPARGPMPEQVRLAAIATDTAAVRAAVTPLLLAQHDSVPLFGPGYTWRSRVDCESPFNQKHAGQWWAGRCTSVNGNLYLMIPLRGLGGVAHVFYIDKPTPQPRPPIWMIEAVDHSHSATGIPRR